MRRNRRGRCSVPGCDVELSAQLLFNERVGVCRSPHTAVRNTHTMLDDVERGTVDALLHDLVQAAAKQPMPSLQGPAAAASKRW
jgi:hypothetical protein